MGFKYERTDNNRELPLLNEVRNDVVNVMTKDDWEVYAAVGNHSEALDDVYAALTELAELIVG